MLHEHEKWFENLLGVLEEQQTTLRMAEKRMGTTASFSTPGSKSRIVDQSTTVVRYEPRSNDLARKISAVISSHIPWYNLSVDNEIDLNSWKFWLSLSRTNPLSDKRHTLIQTPFDSDTVIIGIDATTVTVMKKDGTIKKMDLKSLALKQESWNIDAGTAQSILHTILTNMEAVKLWLLSTANTQPEGIKIIRKGGDNKGHPGRDDSLT